MASRNGLQHMPVRQLLNGSGRHAPAVPMENAITSQKFAYAATIVLVLCLPIAKISICLAYVRIFYSDKRGRLSIQILTVILALTGFVWAIELSFQCKPISAYWTELRPADKCLEDISGFYINGTLNVLADIVLIGIILPRVLNLKLNPRQRYALIRLVLLGWLAVVAGIVRMIRVGTVLGNKVAMDPSWDFYDVSIWTSTEIYVSLICASAPGIKPLVAKLPPQLLGTTLRSRTRTRSARQQSDGTELSSKLKGSTLTTEHESVSMTGADGSEWNSFIRDTRRGRGKFGREK
ncbi:hypothetical protein K469DRAFT_672921 [Zopfia rhizophila CBS 207.26]|uniref:Rhodopsin domain-containing protein n=1 Tax=Zopfia rhizophila CBS 207.26 TaxID=1314779 RepID=A0A6A6DQE3_9PEZI|nr:hypothetical protein K469DRAFT_672921 [Zopfia rhizophila CBS 207.26]